MGLLTFKDQQNIFLQGKDFLHHNEAILNPDFYNNADFGIEIYQEIANHENGLTLNYLHDVGLLREMKRRGLYFDGMGVSDILVGYEKLNVDFPNGFKGYMRHF